MSLPRWVGDLTVADLRHLAAAIEARSPTRRALRNLSPEAIEELAEMLVRGDSPTVGWFEKHRPVPVPGPLGVGHG